jgi:hypothetical protein
VIADVNRALRGLLAPLLPEACEIRFAAPQDDKAGDAIMFFLADVREDEKASGTDWTDVRDTDGRVVARRPPVRRFDLDYLVTVAAADPAVEADLLDAVLVAVDPGRRLAAELLGDALAGNPVTLRLGMGAATAYAGLGGPPRTTLRVIANAPLVLPVVTDVAAPAENIRLDVAAPGRAAPARQPAQAAPRRWRGTRITEEDHAGRSEDE